MLFLKKMVCVILKNKKQLLKSTRLYSIDRVTGAKGYNLAAVMLLGKDDVIADVVPAYVTDALLRKVNTDRYDDREIIKTNLIESYEQLMEFGRKHLPDRFFLEEDQRKSLRNIITREMIANTLIHREYTSSYQAKFVIEKDRMYVENANRASQQAVLTPDDIEPNPKNPIIAAFFRNIGYADQLGSGVRNLFKYSEVYSGKEPEFVEGDVFRIIVPLDEALMNEGTTQSTQAPTQPPKFPPKHPSFCSDIHPSNMISDKDDTTRAVLGIMKERPTSSQMMIARELGMNVNALKYLIRKLRKEGKIERIGTSQKGKWIVK